MKIKASSKVSRLFLIARFEQFHVCDFSASVSECMNDLCYTSRMSKCDAGLNRFYVRVSVSGIADVYRDGSRLGSLYRYGEDGYEGKTGKEVFEMLCKTYPTT